MRVLHVLPRRTNFTRLGATSQDLYVSEIVASSLFADTTWVAAEVKGGQPLWSKTIPLELAGKRRHIRRILDVTRDLSPDVVVVHQHLPTAASIAYAELAPVILIRHNYLKSIERSFNIFNVARRARKARQLRLLSGIAFVSNSVRDDFAQNWGDIKIKVDVVENGITFHQEHPIRDRVNEILCVGRADPQKGILEAAHATAKVLMRHKDWFATFIISEGGENPSNSAAIREAARPAHDRFQVLYDLPHDLVRAYNERAAIAIIPSIWREPFGRTALEAHAGGAAVVTSGTGGLAEISGHQAIFLNEVTPQAIEAAINRLIQDDRLRAELASGGWERARNMFDIRGIAQKLDAFLGCVVPAGQNKHLPAQVADQVERV